MKRNRSSIVYVNFAPYDNAGRILDYLTDNFDYVLHFSYDHLRLKNGRRSKLEIYEHGEKVIEKKLIWMRTPSPLLFPSLPFVALAIGLQTIWYSYKYKKKKSFDIYLSVNAYTSWIGNILRSLSIVSKTIFWVWDYFPVNYPEWRLNTIRWIYSKLDQPSIKASDEVIFLNKQLEKVRKEIGILSEKKSYPVVQIGTNPRQKVSQKKSLILGHMGMLKKSQGLDILFDVFDKLIELFPSIKVEIIGSGPEEYNFKKRAKKYAKHITFYGFVEKDDDVDKIINKWSIGLATYLPDPSSEHYWTDPSKIKAYLNQGVPVITTSVPEFAKEIKKYNAGIVVDYYKPDEFLSAVKTLAKKRNIYSTNALKLAKKYYYKKLYKKLFT